MDKISLINIVQHTCSVREGVKKSLLVADMPKGSYLTAKNANVDYIHANWGYSKINVDVKSINNIKDIIDII